MLVYTSSHYTTLNLSIYQLPSWHRKSCTRTDSVTATAQSLQKRARAYKKANASMTVKSRKCNAKNLALHEVLRWKKTSPFSSRLSRRADIIAQTVKKYVRLRNAAQCFLISTRNTVIDEKKKKKCGQRLTVNFARCKIRYAVKKKGPLCKKLPWKKKRERDRRRISYR